jgi:hypothetical protein
MRVKLPVDGQCAVEVEDEMIDLQLPESGDTIVRHCGLANHQHLAFSVLHHLLRYGPEQHPRELGSTPMSDHDQIGVVAVRVIDDLLRRMSDADLEMRLDAPRRCRGLQLRKQAAMVPARILDDRFALDVIADFGRSAYGQYEKFGTVLRGKVACGGEGLFRRFRAVVANEDSSIHG